MLQDNKKQVTVNFNDGEKLKSPGQSNDLTKANIDRLSNATPI